MPQNLASYASNPALSKGRLHHEEPTFRNEFQRDVNRIINSAAFRRLEYKTQVFVNDKGDHYRTRLTHSLEVAQIAKVIASALGLATDLAECLSLAHDLGHPPFGHAGEEALDKKLAADGGFNHNEYTLKLLTALEERYIKFNGLNLSYETLDGIIKHNGPIKSIDKNTLIYKYAKEHRIILDRYPSLEAQVAGIADDIAYNSHDLEDGLRAKLFTIADIHNAGVFTDIINEVRSLDQDAQEQRIIHEIIRRLVNQMVTDVLATSNRNLESMRIENIEQVYRADKLIVNFSESMQEKVGKLKKFLLLNMYRHYTVNRMTYRAKKIVAELFDVFSENSGCLPDKWQARLAGANKSVIIADYIAGMTDRFAAKEHELLCNF